MTEDANKLADAIDPRLQPPETVTGGMSWVLQTKDLIAASDFIRRHSTLPSEVREAVDAAYERAARYHDQAEADTAAEHPGVQGSKSQKRREKFHRESATAIRAMKGKTA